MVGKTDKTPQMDMYRTPLVHFIDINHELCQLADQIDWEKLELEFSDYYANFGRPGIPIRKMVGLVILKHLKNQSDERAAQSWVENPYWQYFTGEVYFQTNQPFDPSEFVHFRKRIGEEGCEKILKMTISLYGDEAIEEEVQIDTTVQEKNITFPTDTKLHTKIVTKCRTIAEKEGIALRQSYKRVLKQLLLDQRNRSHPKNKKKAAAAARKIKTIAGRLVRELERKLPDPLAGFYKEKLDLFNQVLSQTKATKNKIYSLHEPKVKCIAKGKDAKRYEFGNKSSIAKTRKSGIIVGAIAFEENLYDGDTLGPQLEQIRRMTGSIPEVATVDRGYRGRTKVGNTAIALPKPPLKKATKYQKTKARKRFRARASIEPIIGHVKHDHRMIRNYLSGVEGDKVNTLLAAAAFNLAKMLNRIREEVKNILSIFQTLIYNNKNCYFLSEN
jgi:IS5 family transposase